MRSRRNEWILATGWRRARLLIVTSLVVGGCTMVTANRWDDMFGPAEPRDRLVSSSIIEGASYINEVQPILEQRCIVCHGCYDAPCQLKLSSPEGIDRGASKEKVYNSARLGEADPTRLFEDAQSTGEWRGKGFWPVLNEHDQTAASQSSGQHHAPYAGAEAEKPTAAEPDPGRQFRSWARSEARMPRTGRTGKIRQETPAMGDAVRSSRSV